MKHFFTVAALICSSPLIAQLSSDSTTLSDVVVTANKYPRKQAQTGKNVTVIPREQLERSAGRNLTELLNQQAGFAIIGANNAPGTNQDVYLRGAAIGKTLILLDGIPVYDPSSISTAFDLNTIPIDGIERIEIVKGALSTLYGSDAVAGVINIITRKAGAKPVQVNATIGAGSTNTDRNKTGALQKLDAAKAALNINGRASILDYGFSISHYNGGAFSTAHDSTGQKNFDEDGMIQDGLRASVGITPARGVHLEAYGNFSRYKADLDGAAFRDDADYSVRTGNLAAGLRNNFRFKKGTLFLNYQYSLLERKYRDDSASRSGGYFYHTRSDYSGSTHFAELYGNLELHKNLELLAGGDHRYYHTGQSSTSTSGFGAFKSALGADSARAAQTSAFSSLLLRDVKGINLELGLRLNLHSEYGTNLTYTINPSYTVKQRVKLFANYATGFKAPTPYQLFDAFAGNKNLDPETSSTVEAGAELLAWQGLTARATYFLRDVHHGIDYNFATNKYFNYNRQEDKGYELEASFTHSVITVNTAFSHVTGKVNMPNYVFNSTTFSYDIKGDTSFNNLFRRPANIFTATVGVRPLRKLFFSSTAKWVDERMEPQFGGAPLPLKAYTTIDLYGDYSINSNMRVFADARNILGEKYFDVLGYNTKRFHFMVGLLLRL